MVAHILFTAPALNIGPADVFEVMNETLSRSRTASLKPDRVADICSNHRYYAHSVNGLGKGVTVFPGDVRTQDDLLEAPKAGEFFPVEVFHLGQPVEYGGRLDQIGQVVRGAEGQ